MNVELKEISETEFRELNLPVLFENKLADRVFGIVSNGKSKFKLTWQSTGIKPTVVMLSVAICLMGIDLTFVIFDFNKEKVLLKLTLDYFFYDVKIHNDFLYVITELEIIKITTSEFAITERYGLPDYFESIEFTEKGIIVSCSGNEVVSFDA